MRLTIKDIARLANVSVGTASLAMNDKPTVNAETKRHVQEIAKKYNYTPNHSARSLITKKSACIGLVVTDISNPFFATLVDEFHKLLDRSGYTMLLGISGDRVATERKYVDMFIGKNVEGVIIVPTIEERPDLQHLYELRSREIPFVFCTAAYNGFSEPCIMTDLKQGEYLLVKHLLTQGMKKIHFITGSHELQLSRLRLEGYYQAYKEAGLTYQSDWVIETIPDFSHGYKAALRCLKDRPDAIVTVNDYLAMGVIKALHDKHVKIPKEISVAGYDDLLFASIIETPLTTVRQPIDEICKKTLEVLFRLMDGDSNDERLSYLQPELKIRESTS
jgi:DNA-binding LacI/PurR family transcriptional regulator